MSDFETLTVTRDGGAVTVKLARPSVHNAINLQMCRDLVAAFDNLRFDASARLVLLRADGPTFCAGVDLVEMRANDTAWGIERRHRGLDAYLAVERCPIPVVAVVHAPAYGGGCELASATDFIIASAQATFQWPEAAHGGVGATQRLPRLVGQAKARELLFTAGKIDADEALRIGFVSTVASPEQFEQTVQRYTQQMLAVDASAVRGIKHAMRTGESSDRATAIDIERQAIELAMTRRQQQ